jgi:hypothetical protein
VLRELVQNADDANASVLVLRFEEDGLYAANDGFAFRTAPKGGGGADDFVRAAQILERHKEGDKESAGHFGSGFQTVYAITNRPEVYSNGYSRALNPLTGKWENLDSERNSPYMSEPVGHKGVLFRLPWRDSAAAKSSYEGKQHFSEERFWPRWDTKAIRGLYDDLKPYLHPVLLCCQRVLTIRIVWAAGGRREAYQATRDFTLNDPLPKPAVVEVQEGVLATTPGWFEWDGGVAATSAVPASFSGKEGRFEMPKRMRYFASSGLVTEGGFPAFLVKERGGNVAVSRTNAGEIKKNHLHLLFPLFVGGRAFLYSVIPLPRRGGNNFAFSAHLYPIEARNDVDVQGNGGINGRWYRSCMLSIAKLFKETFPRFLDQAKAAKEPLEVRQAVILQALPRNEIREWMRPGKSTEDIEWARSETESLRSWLFEQPILVSGEGWFSPVRGYLAGADDLDVLQALGLPIFPKAFVDMLEQVHWLKTLGESRKFTPKKFIEIVSRSKLTGVGYNSTLTVSETGGSARLDRQTIARLASYAIVSGEGATELPLFPSEAGPLKPLSDFPKLPEGFEVVYRILPPERRIHKELEGLVSKLEEKSPPRRPIRQSSELPRLVADAIKLQPGRFEILSDVDRRMLSAAVAKMVLDEHFAEDVARGQVFLPCRYQGAIRVGPANFAKRPEDYQRGWIFADQERGEIPGLTEEVAKGIMFLALEGIPEKDAEKIQRKLTIRELAELDGKPTNFVRHFLAGEESLFVDGVLEQFIGAKYRKSLDSQKRSLLEAVKSYFTGFTEQHREKTEIPRKEMGSVPCLFDPQGKWCPAKEFARASGPLQSLFEYRTLSPYFNDWSRDTLYAIGVETEFTPEVVAGKIAKLAEGRGNRHELGTALGAILLGSGSEDLRKIGELLKGVEWVPVNLTKKASLQNALFPNGALKASLGEEHERYVELESMGRELRQKLEALDSKGLEQKLSALGMVSSPQLEDLTLALESCSKKGRDPPPALLTELNRVLAPMGTDERRKWRESVASPKFYWKPNWYDPDEVRVLNKDEELPTSPPSGTLVLSPEESGPFKSYLESIGVTPGLGALDFLRWLRDYAKSSKGSAGAAEGQREGYNQIVKRLEPLTGAITNEMAADFGAQEIALIGPSWLAPQDILLDDCGLVGAPVRFDEDCLVPASLSPSELLARLGATKLSKLDGAKAGETMRRLAQVNHVSEEQSGAYLKMLAYGIRANWWLAEDPLPWPTVPASDARFLQPSKGLLMNEAAAAFFVGLPILKTITGDGSPGALSELAEKWGAKGADDIKYPGMDMSVESRAYETERLMADIHYRLVEIFPRDKASLEWMGGTKVHGVKEGFQKYQAGANSGYLKIPAILPLGAGSTALVLPGGSTLDAKEMAKMISSWSLGAGFPKERQDDLENAIEVLHIDRQKALESELYVNPQIPGYLQTLRKLDQWYRGCQICGWRTPSDTSGSTKESIQSIVCERGGLFPGPLTRYEEGNSLYLCPRHAILKGRRLVDLDFMKGWEGSPSEVKARIQRAIENLPAEEYRIDVSVYEWNVREKEEEGWRLESLTLNPKHGKALYERLLRYIETRE